MAESQPQQQQPQPPKRPEDAAESARAEARMDAAKASAGGPDDPRSQQPPTTVANESQDPAGTPRGEAGPRRIQRGAAQPKANTIWVMSAVEDDKVALWERDPAHPAGFGHPAGEAFVANDGLAHEVGDTPGVRLAIRDGKLEEVAGGEAKSHNEAVLAERDEARKEALAALRANDETNRLALSQGGTVGSAVR